jgi:Tfp pilus assembly protein PilV
MRNMICKNKKGITLVESIVSMLLLTIGVLAILSMQPTSMKTGARSDYLGRGVMLLNKELMAQELFIMNPCNDVTTGTVTNEVYMSGRTSSSPGDGDARFNVQTVTSVIAGSPTAWRVSVTITWPPYNTNGVRETIIVTRQESFRSGCI